MMRSRQRGFTLLEMLVVAALLATLTGFALLSVDLAGTDEKLQRELIRISELISLQCEQAQLHGHRAGLLLQADAYAFVQWQNEHWLLLEQRPFAPRLLPEAAQPQLEVAGYPARLFDGDLARDQIVPQIICYDSGELTPFSLSLGVTEPTTILQGQLDGAIAINNQ